VRVDAVAVRQLVAWRESFVHRQVPDGTDVFTVADEGADHPHLVSFFSRMAKPASFSAEVGSWISLRRCRMRAISWCPRRRRNPTSFGWMSVDAMGGSPMGSGSTVAE